MSAEIKREAWLQAIREIEGAENDPDAVTTYEFMQMSGLPESTAKRRLRKMVQRGRARVTRKRDHRGIIVTAYRLTTP